MLLTRLSLFETSLWTCLVNAQGWTLNFNFFSLFFQIWNRKPTSFWECMKSSHHPSSHTTWTTFLHSMLHLFTFCRSQTLEFSLLYKLKPKSKLVISCSLSLSLSTSFPFHVKASWKLLEFYWSTNSHQMCVIPFNLRCLYCYIKK